VYRGGHARKDDPDAARFAFGSTQSGLKEPRPVTPPGLARPGAGGAPPVHRPPLPGRQVATVPSRRRFWPGWRKGIPLIIGVVLLLFIGWLYLGYRSFSDEVANANKRLDNRTKRALTPAGHIVTSPQVTLVLGSDSRGEHTTARADSILLFRTDPGKHLVSMLSIPRDLRVPISGHGDTKINAAFAYGGAPLLIRTINNLTGLRVNHIVLVNFTGFKDLINSLGGVSVYNSRKIVSSQPFDGIMWHFKKGTLHLDGRRALAYARIRHTTDPRDSDITRTERQQLVMQAISRQLVSPSSLFHLPSVGRDIARPLATDLSANELLGLGWEKFRASRTLECHLGGDATSIDGQDEILSVGQNRVVIQMFLGETAPQPPAPGSLYSPGCRVK
jgi:LCP family protein required for cell wall assembly